MEKAYEWLLEEFDIDGAAARILRNVLEYYDVMRTRLRECCRSHSKEVG